MGRPTHGHEQRGVLHTLDKGVWHGGIFTPDGKRVYLQGGPGPSDVGWRAWDVASGRLLGEGVAAEAWEYPLAFSADGRWAISDRWDGSYQQKAYLVLWEVASGEVLRNFDQRRGGVPVNLSRGQALAAAFTPDAKQVVSTDRDLQFRRWDVATGKEVQSVSEGFDVCLFTPDGRLAFTAAGVDIAPRGDSIRLKLWDTATLTVLRTFDRPRRQ